MIHSIDYPRSEGVEKEIRAIREGFESLSLETYFTPYPTAESYFAPFLAIPEGAELARLVPQSAKPLRILDIGPGKGQSTFYLASLGHQVVAVEPSPESCQVIDYGQQLYQLPIIVYDCVAEVLDKLPEAPFDIILFNSSLHHCDDPVLALRHCYSLLVKGGKLLIINEPFLPFFRSKSWYEDRLTMHPQEMGHYGGNEHIYHYIDYRRMIEAAHFSDIVSELNIRNRDYSCVMRQLEGRSLKGQPIYSASRLRVRKLYFSFIHLLSQNRWIGAPVLAALQRLSLVVTSFIATK